MRVVFALFLMFGFLFALPENKIESDMKVRLNNVEAVLKDKALTKEDKRKKLFNMLDDIFDFEIMAKISLGRPYNTLSKAQQEEFVKNFVVKLKNSYLDKIDLYNGQKLQVDSLTKVKNDRINLNTQINGQNEKYDIIYKFYPKEKEWLIYDIDIIGVSIVQTYRKQFGEFLATKSVNELLESLK